MVFGNFDGDDPNWELQANIFGQVVATCIRNETGVDVNCLAATAKRGGGGKRTTIKCLMQVSKGVDANDDRVRGASVALFLADETECKECVDAELQSQTGFASALLDKSSNLAGPVSNNAPGIVGEPAAEPITLLLTAHPTVTNGYILAPDADLLNGVAADVLLKADPLVIGGRGPQDRVVLRFQKDITTSSSPITDGDLELATTSLIVDFSGTPATYTATLNTLTAALTLQKDAGNIGTLIDGGVVVGDRPKLLQAFFVSASSGRIQEMDSSIRGVWDRLGSSRTKGITSVEDTAPVFGRIQNQSTHTLKFTNVSGGTILAGTSVIELLSFGTAVSDALA
jgi:hypothetical protein